MKSRKKNPVQRKKRTPATLFSPFESSKLPALTEEEMMFAYRVGSAAASYRMPMVSPQAHSIRIKDKDGHVDVLSPTDIPFNRLALAVRDHFGEGEEGKFFSFMSRYWGVMKLRDDPRMDRWIKPDEQDGENGVLIASALFAVAGSEPMNDKMEFDADRFFRRIEELADEDDANGVDQTPKA